METKLIAFDMDGTLLNEKNEITKNTLCALRELQKRGIKLALVTGRVYVSPYHYKVNSGLNMSIAATNGAVVYDENENIIYKSSMAKELVNKVLDLLKGTDYYFHLYPIDGLITSHGENHYSKIEGRMPPGTEKYMRRVILPFEDLYNINDEIYKIIIIFKNLEDRKKFRILLDQNGIFNSSSWFNNIEITNKEATKEHAITALMKKFNLKKEEVMAFGDNENDLPMLNMVGKPFLMGNSAPEIRSQTIAKIIGKNSEEGVYKTLKDEFNIKC